jgi:hypothetical protein
VKRFILGKLNKVEGREQYHVEISYGFATLENLGTEVDVNNSWETIRENIKISAKENLGSYELNHYKPWFDEVWSKLLHQRKQARLQRLQDPSEINGDYLNNTRREASRNFRKKGEYLKDKINELARNGKNKNIRDLYSGINEYKRGYQPRNNLLKYENGDLLADSHNILNRWKNHYSQLLNVHRVSDVRQTEIRTAEPLVPESSPCQFEIAIAKLKRFKSLGSDEIPAELIQAGGEILRSKFRKKR